MTNQIPDTTIKKPQFTPGEWAPLHAFVYALNDEGFNRFDVTINPGWVADGVRTPQAELEANAALIAAAPRLYEALMNLAFSYDARDRGDGCWCRIENDETHFERRGEHDKWCLAARAALSLVDHPEEAQSIKCQRCSTRDAIKNETFCLPCRQELDQQRRDQRRSANEGNNG